MKQDRLHKDRDEIHNLDDLIEARRSAVSSFAEDADSLQDVDLPDSVDVEGSLTFPHPKHKKPARIDLMSVPHEEDTEDDQVQWAEQEMLPSDYSHSYNDGTSTFVTDDEDEIQEQRIHDAGRLDVEQVAEEPPVEQMPSKFTPDEQTKG